MKKNDRFLKACESLVVHCTCGASFKLRECLTLEGKFCCQACDGQFLIDIVAVKHNTRSKKKISKIGE